MNDQYVDAHLHLQDEKCINRVEQLVEEARCTRVTMLLSNAVTENDWATTTALGRRYDSVIPFLGIHPWYADRAAAGWENRLAKLLHVLSRPAGIGESGLDKHCGVDLSVQISLFQAHLELAFSFSLPLTVHCVRCWGLLVDLLESRAKDSRLPLVLIHAFNGSVETMKRLTRLGCYISFTPAIVEKQRDKIRQVFLQTPLEYLLLETDAPNTPFPPLGKSLEPGGKWSEPTLMPLFYQWAAKQRGSEPGDFIEQLFCNAQIYTNTTSPG